MLPAAILWIVALVLLPVSIWVYRRVFRHYDSSPWLFWFWVAVSALFGLLILIDATARADAGLVGLLAGVPFGLIAFAVALVGGLYLPVMWDFAKRVNKK